MAESEIIYVDQSSAAADDLGECNAATPCKTVAGAITRISGGLDARAIMVVRGDATVVYGGALTMDDITVTLIGAGATIRPNLGQDDTPAIQVTGESTLSIENLQIGFAASNYNADGIRCSGAGSIPKVALRHVTILWNDATGIDATQCALTIERSTVTRNDLGGISISNSEFVLVNNFVVRNGTTFSGVFGGIRIVNFDPVEKQFLDFNTVVANAAPSGSSATGVICSLFTPMTAKGNVVYKGSSGPPAVINDNCAWTYSNIEGGMAGTGNIDMAPTFLDEGNGDYHLAGGPGVDVDGLTSTIEIDFDGDIRPQNGLFDMGADEYTMP